MLHTSLTGAAGHDPYAPCSIADLTRTGFDYWALGHIHKRQVHAKKPWVVMPGNPQGRDIGESGPKSASLITIEAGVIAVSEVPTSAVEFRHSSVSLDELEDDDAIRTRLRAHLADEAAVVDGAIIRLRLTGATPRGWAMRRDRDMWAEVLGQMASDTGRLWIEKLEFDVTPPVEAAAGDAVGELHNLMAEIAGEDGFSAAAQQEMEQMLALLPQARRAELVPDPAALAALLERLTGSAVLAMTAAMRGADGEAAR
jgi:exonuclease SbcD